jgi:phage terminase large subunit-like protein
VRDVLIEGESGILEKSPPWFRPKWEPTRRRLTWPNGAIATTYSAENPDELRGPQHDGAICDELATWRYPEAWDNLMLGLRLGTDPRVVVGTTPKPVRLLKAVRALPTCVITSGATYENVDNLAPAFREHIISRYEGTRLGRQELGGELIEDNPAALWKREQLEAGRVLKAPDLVRVVVGVDPAISAKDESDETGIIVAGKGADGHAYVLDDLSLRASPDGWARAAVTAYHRNSADRIVAEVNQGGDMVENTVRTVDRNVAYSAVHASRGKYSRAEPIAALYEQGKVHHVGTFAELEDQQCQWVPGDKSPDRLDALVWAITALGLTARAPGKAETFRR